jgi:phosphohistidine phosphatase SixA
MSTWVDVDNVEGVNCSEDEDAAGSQARHKRGRRDAPRMGELVREYGLIPDVVISSDAVRARLTAEAVAEAARYTGEILLSGGPRN